MRIELSLNPLMSKRSVNKKDKDKKTEGQPGAGAKPQDAEPVQTAKAGRAGVWQNTDLYWYVGLLLAVLLSFYLRAIKPLDRVFVGDKVIFSSETDAWYHMMLAKSTVINLQRLWFDPMTYFPNGTPLHFGPFLSWAIAIVSYILSLGQPSMHTVEVVGAFMPAILGALVVIPVYFIGRELGGKSCGLISALIAAVLPGQYFSRTALGFTDHHAAEILLSTLTMMFLLLALGSSRGMTFAALQKSWPTFKRPLLFAALAGISLGLYIDAWASGFLIEGMILLFIVVQSVADHMQGKNVEYLGVAGAITFFIATLLVLPFVKPYNGFSNYYYSLFQPTILLLGVAAVILVASLSGFLKEKGYSNYYYPGAVAGILVFGTLVLALVIPQFIDVLFSGMSIFQPKTGGAATVGEAASLFTSGGVFSFNNVLIWFPGFMALSAPGFIAFLFTTFTLSLVGLLLLVLRYVKRPQPVEMLVITWSVIVLLLTLAQNRFAYYYAVNVAILTGFLCVWILQKLGLGDLESRSADIKEPVKFLTSNLKIVAAALLIFLFIILPSYTMSLAFANSVGGPDSDWLTSTAWLENNTPSPGMDLYKIYEHPPDSQKYAYPEEAYGIMSWWDFGHLIETVGHRIPNANPFQQGIGNLTAGRPGSSPFFLSESEAEAENVLAGIDPNRSPYKNTKYVMIDWDMAVGKFYAMTQWSSVPITKYYGFFYQPQGDQLVPVGVYRDPYFETMTARLFFFDGSETPVTNAFAIAYQYAEQDGMRFPVIVEAPLVSENYSELVQYVNESKAKGYMAEIVSSRDAVSPSTSVPLEAMQHYRLVHESEHGPVYQGTNFVKTFEHVPGAVIKGSAAPGTNVSVAVPVMTNIDRAFVYRQSNITDASGQFTLVVPYSTEGPIAGGTNFDTRPLGPYQLSVGDTNYEVRVPEEYVLSGREIDVTG
jgi:oligosaccharyl transferase (archaeosortase A-associated)